MFNIRLKYDLIDAKLEELCRVNTVSHPSFFIFVCLYSSISRLVIVCCFLQVGDFGLSRIKRNTLISGGVRGTLPWMAPELLSGSSSRVSEKVCKILLQNMAPCESSK